MPGLVPLLPPDSSCPPSPDYPSSSPSSGKSSRSPPTQPLSSQPHQGPYPLSSSSPAVCVPPRSSGVWGTASGHTPDPSAAALGLPAFLARGGWLARKRPQTSAPRRPPVSAPPRCRQRPHSQKDGRLSRSQEQRSSTWAPPRRDGHTEPCYPPRPVAMAHFN